MPHVANLFVVLQFAVYCILIFKKNQLAIIISNIAIFILATYALFVFKKLPSSLKIFSRLIFFSALFQLTCIILWYKRINNLPLLHLFLPVEFLCICSFFQNVLAPYIKKNIIIIILVVFSLFSIINSLFLETIYHVNSNAIIIESILVTSLSVLAFTYIRKYYSIKESTSLLWIIKGLFIKFTSNLLLIIFASFFHNFLFTNFNIGTWILHTFFSYVMYAFFFVGFWKRVNYKSI